MSYQVKLEKIIERSSGEIFSALKEGLLFLNCGVCTDSMQIDFRVGGQYKIEFKNMQKIQFGEFLEIIPNKKIVFSWCQDFGPDQEPNTRVSIELFEDGPKTKLVLVHTGFKNQELTDAHQKGWAAGTNDFTSEIQDGALRLIRTYKTTATKLFETCKNPETFFAIMGDLSRGTVDFKVGGKYQLPTKQGEIRGEFLEIVHDKKIAMSWLSGCHGPLKSQVTLTITQKDAGNVSLELVHKGLHTLDDKKSTRRGWEVVTKKISQYLN